MGWGNAVAAGLGLITGKQEEDHDKHMASKTNKYTQENLILGNQLDMQNQKDMFDFRLSRARGAGLTNVEAFGSPAASPGGGTSGSGATLGNAASQQGIASRQIAQQRNANMRTNIMQMATALRQTKMQTDSQKDVAKIQAGVTTRGQDVQEKIAQNTLNLNTRELEQVKLPQAANQLQLTKQQVQTEINKTATSSEKFQKEMKQLSMGPANLLVELTMRDLGISLADDSFTNLPEAKRAEFLKKLLAMASSIYIESSGAAALGSQISKATGADTIADWIAKLITATDSGGIEPTESTRQSPQLGKGARFSEPGAHSPNMNYR